MNALVRRPSMVSPWGIMRFCAKAGTWYTRTAPVRALQRPENRVVAIDPFGFMTFGIWVLSRSQQHPLSATGRCNGVQTVGREKKARPGIELGARKLRRVAAALPSR